MGFLTNRFIKPVDPNLICGICSGVLDEPMLTPCGHTFCEGCIKTWLDKTSSDTNTCPECRTLLGRQSLRPVLSLRNFIMSLEVTCSNKSLGCQEIIKIDSQENHLKMCRYVDVICEICKRQIEKPDNQLPTCKESDVTNAKQDSKSKPEGDASSFTLCFACKNSINEEYKSMTIKSTSTALSSGAHERIGSDSSDTFFLLQRIHVLEKQIAQLLDDLHEAQRINSPNMVVQRQRPKRNVDLGRTKVQVPATTVRNRHFHHVNASQQEIIKLSVLLARNLLQKPSRIDKDKIFKTIRQYYEMYYCATSHPSANIDLDIHVLLATAFASNWFTGAQKITLGCWLQCLSTDQIETLD